MYCKNTAVWGYEEQSSPTSEFIALINKSSQGSKFFSQDFQKSKPQKQEKERGRSNFTSQHLNSLNVYSKTPDWCPPILARRIVNKEV